MRGLRGLVSRTMQNLWKSLNDYELFKTQEKEKEEAMTPNFKKKVEELLTLFPECPDDCKWSLGKAK